MGVPLSAVTFVKLFALFVLLSAITVSCYGVFGSDMSRMKQQGKFKDNNDAYWGNRKEKFGRWLDSIQFEKGLTKGYFEKNEKLKAAFHKVIQQTQTMHEADQSALNMEYTSVALFLIGFLFIYFLSFTLQLISGQDYPKKGNGDKVLDIVIMIAGLSFVLAGTCLIVSTSVKVCSFKKYSDLTDKMTKLDVIFRDMSELATSDSNQTSYKLVWKPDGKLRRKRAASDWDDQAKDKQEGFKMFELNPAVTMSSYYFRSIGRIDASSSSDRCHKLWKTTEVICGGIIGGLVCVIIIPTLCCVGCMKEPKIDVEELQPEFDPNAQEEPYLTPADTLVNNNPPGQVGYDPQSGSYGLKSATNISLPSPANPPSETPVDTTTAIDQNQKAT